MSTHVEMGRRLWVPVIALAICFGAIAGWASAFLGFSPEVRAAREALQRALPAGPPQPAATSTPLEIIPIQAPDQYFGLPATLRAGRASPTLPLFRLDARAVEPLLPLAERIGIAVALTADGWVVAPESTFPAGIRLAETGIGWQGKVLIPSKGVRDRAAGLVFLKVEARDLPPASLLSRFEVERGQPVWEELVPNVYVPEVVAGFAFAPSSSVPVSSDQWNRRFVLGGVQDAAAAVWDARGRLVGLALPGQTAVPADAIRGALAGVLANGEVRRPWLGVRYLELADVFARSAEPRPAAGALLKADRRAVAVTPNGPAANVLKEGDILERVDQDVLDGSWTLAERLADYRPGASVTIAGVRQGKPFEVRVTLGATTTSEVIR